MERPTNKKNFLTVGEVDIVRRSFLNLGVENAHAGEVFYRQLFTLQPELRGLFVGDMDKQSEKMTNMLGMIVSQIHNMPELLPMLSDLAKRHLVYGVRVEHYQHVGHALLSMMKEIMGHQFNTEVAEAWTKAYDGIAITMIYNSFGQEGAAQYRSST